MKSRIRKLKSSGSFSRIHADLFIKSLAEAGVFLRTCDRKYAVLEISDTSDSRFLFCPETGDFDHSSFQAALLTLRFLYNKFDGLTGLMKRETFREEFSELVRKSVCGYLSFAVLDIDFFKKINDSFGHIEGDRVLALFSSVISRVTAIPGCICGRYGGEEFIVVLLHDMPEDGQKLIGRIRHEILRENFGISGRVNFSSGLITRKLRQEQNEDYFLYLLEKADLALYRAKNMGRGVTVSYDSLLSSGGKVISRFPNHEIVINYGLRHGLNMGDRFLVIDQKMNGSDIIPGTAGDMFPRRIKGEIMVPGDPGLLQSESAVCSIVFELQSWPVSTGDILEKYCGKPFEIHGKIISYREHASYDFEWIYQKICQCEKSKFFMFAVLLDDVDIFINRLGYDSFLKMSGELREYWSSQCLGESAMLNLGDFLFFCQKQDTSVQLFKKKLSGMFPGCRKKIVFFDQVPEKDFLERLKTLKPFLPVETPQGWDGNLFVRAGQNALKQGETQSAVRMFEFASDHSEVDPDLININLFTACKLSRNFEKAMEIFHQISKKEPAHILYGMAGECCFFLNQTAEARKYYEKSLKISPDYEYSLNNLAHLIACDASSKKSELKKAYEMISRALAISPGTESYMDTMEKIRLRLCKN